MEEFHIFFFPDCIHTFSHTPGSEEQASRSPGRGQLIGYDPCQAFASMSAHIGHHSSAHADTSYSCWPKKELTGIPITAHPGTAPEFWLLSTFITSSQHHLIPLWESNLYFLFSSVCLKSQTEQEQASMSPSSDFYFKTSLCICYPCMWMSVWNPLDPISFKCC